MKIRSGKLIEELVECTRQNINTAERFKQRSESELNHKQDTESWSALECLAHLNLYGDFYIPEIDKRMEQSSSKPAAYFKSGLLGNYFAKSMMPKSKLNKMKTFKSMNPAGSQLGISVLNKFLDQQFRMLELLNRSRQVNIQNVKTEITISKWIKLRLGDTFRVVIYHNKRHMLQAKNALAAVTAV